MTDDGSIVHLSHEERDALLECIHLIFSAPRTPIEFPWDGPRDVYVDE